VFFTVRVATLACPCGVVFGEWVTPEDADLDLRHLAALD
jgi:hypothetical protein